MFFFVFINWLINCSCFPDCFLSQSKYYLEKGKGSTLIHWSPNSSIHTSKITWTWIFNLITCKNFSVLDCIFSRHLMIVEWSFETNYISLFSWRLTRNNLHSFHFKLINVSRFQISWFFSEQKTKTSTKNWHSWMSWLADSVGDALTQQCWEIPLR